YVYVPVGELEDRADYVVEAVDAVVVADLGQRAAHVELHVVGEDLRQCVLVAADRCGRHSLDHLHVWVGGGAHVARPLVAARAAASTRTVRMKTASAIGRIVELSDRTA